MFNQDICKRCMLDLSNYYPGWRGEAYKWNARGEGDTKAWAEGHANCPDAEQRKIDGSDNSCPFTLEHVMSVGQ